MLSKLGNVSRPHHWNGDAVRIVSFPDLRTPSDASVGGQTAPNLKTHARYGRINPPQAGHLRHPRGRGRRSLPAADRGARRRQEESASCHTRWRWRLLTTFSDAAPLQPTLGV